MTVTHLTAPQAMGLLAERDDLIVLDMRTGFEFRRGHLPGAIRLGWRWPGLGRHLRALPDGPVLVYCKAGPRSTDAARRLDRAGRADVHHLDGGTDAWRAAGLPLTC